MGSLVFLKLVTYFSGKINISSYFIIITYLTETFVVIYGDLIVVDLWWFSHGGFMVVFL